MAKTLDDVPVEKVWQGQQAALMRLQLYAMGLTHEIFFEMGKGLRDVVLGAGGEDGKIDGLGLALARGKVEKVWQDGFGKWENHVVGLRWEAAAIAFGTVVRLHQEQFSNINFQVSNESRLKPRLRDEGRLRLRDEGGLKPALQEATGDGPTFVFEPQVRRVVNAANERVYGDGLNWSGRVWNLDREGLAGIQREVYAGVANGDSAWDISKRIEQYLGAGQDCPRWTRTRLYSLTKKDIASGDRTGLYSGDECAAQGVAYKALRLARNEIQIAHHMATDAALEKMPWVEKEKVNLSPAHPVEDVCDEVVGGGENGDGVYPKGEVSLPLHVHCLCFKSAVMMGRDEFVDKLRGWMNGTEQWGGMDEYASWIGADTAAAATNLGRNELPALGAGAATAYVTWLWGGEDALKAAVKRSVQLALGI